MFAFSLTSINYMALHWYQCLKLAQRCCCTAVSCRNYFLFTKLYYISVKKETCIYLWSKFCHNVDLLKQNCNVCLLSKLKLVFLPRVDPNIHQHRDTKRKIIKFPFSFSNCFCWAQFDHSRCHLAPLYLTEGHICSWYLQNSDKLILVFRILGWTAPLKFSGGWIK